MSKTSRSIQIGTSWTYRIQFQRRDGNLVQLGLVLSDHQIQQFPLMMKYAFSPFHKVFHLAQCIGPVRPGILCSFIILVNSRPNSRAEHFDFRSRVVLNFVNPFGLGVRGPWYLYKMVAQK